MSDRSPLHRSALRLQDVKNGRRIILYSLGQGILGEFTILGYPYLGYMNDDVQDFGTSKRLVVRTRNEQGEVLVESLWGLGITTNDKAEWHENHFVVPEHKRHLLPSILFRDDED